MDDILKKGFLLAQSKTNNFKVEKELEATASEIFKLIELEMEFPRDSTLNLCKDFLLKVEAWKMMNLKCRIGNAGLNGKDEIYSAFRGVYLKTGDKDKLLSVMNLTGFGSSIDEDYYRRSKAASAVMRFFYPEMWGVVDWRLMAVLRECKNYSWEWSQIIAAERLASKELKRNFDVINEDMCVWLMHEYRDIKRENLSFNRVADIDMALFQISWCLWDK